MNFTKIKDMAQQQLKDPKRRAQVEKLVGTAKEKVAARRSKPTQTNASTTPTDATPTTTSPATPTIVAPATPPATATAKADETPSFDATK